MKTLKEKIEVMQAALAGKEIEIRYSNETKWCTPTTNKWNWEIFDYRIKPENKQVPYDGSNSFDLVTQKFKNIHTDQNKDDEVLVCVKANKNYVVLGDIDVHYEELAKYWLKWNNILNRWESCTKTVKG